MNLSRITQAEASLRRLEARLGSLLEPNLRAELADAVSILSEARLFAVCWEDARQLEKDNPDRSSHLRQASIDRLVQTLRPD